MKKHKEDFEVGDFVKASCLQEMADDGIWFYGKILSLPRTNALIKTWNVGGVACEVITDSDL